MTNADLIDLRTKLMDQWGKALKVAEATGYWVDVHACGHVVDVAACSSPPVKAFRKAASCRRFYPTSCSMSLIAGWMRNT
jgi:hypothetical protein